jgi:hypothetical protein
VRRRSRLQGAYAAVPAELLTFTAGAWADFALAFDPVVDFEGCIASEPLRRKLREFRVWVAARRKWAEAHGWSCDFIEMLRDEVTQKLAMVQEDYAAGLALGDGTVKQANDRGSASVRLRVHE